MNDAHWHLVVNHLPVIAAPLVFVLLLYGIARHEPVVIRAALIGVVLAALFTFMAGWTGDGAKDMVEGMAGVDASAISPHEDRADVSLTVIEITGGFTLLVLLSEIGVLGTACRGFATRQSRALTIFVAGGLGISSALLASTASLGGRIHHPEIEMAQPAARSEQGKAGD